MQKLCAVALGTILVTGAATAGQIQIGGANGLTSSYITSNGGSISGFSEYNYDNRLFQGATPAPTAYPGYSTTAADGGATATTGFLTGDGTYDSGIVFNMINDGLSAGMTSNNFWDGTSANATITIPIGIFGVTDSWLMLNNIWGPAGGSDTVVTFNFGSSSPTSITNSVAVSLTNAGNTTSSASGQIGTSVSCTTTQTATCNTFATGALAPSTTNINGTGVNVYTDTLIDPSYSSIPVGKFAGTAGIVTLDDQDFVFPTADVGEYLVSISVKELNGGNGVSQTALSAITVDTASVAASATPEPASLALLLGGMAMLGVIRFRRN